MAQRPGPSKIPLSYYAFVDQMPEDEFLHIYVKGSMEVLEAQVTALGGWVKYPVGNYLAVAIPAQAIESLAAIEAVEAIHFEITQGKTLLNESRNHARVNDVHDGLGNLPEGYEGEGVIIGVIDAGLDLSHPDFMHADSTTRVLELWDQNLGYHAQRTPSYGYGQVFDNDDIDAGNCPHNDQSLFYGHGTNTTGIAAGGDFDGDFDGMAPKADIIVVSSKFSSFSWTATVADAVNYIFSRAEAYGKPCVINASIGTYRGSHDGRDLASMSMAQMISDTTGRIMVCAAGNSGEEYPYHLGYEASEDTVFTWFQTSSSASVGNGVIYFDVYMNTNDMDGLRFSFGADRVLGYYDHRTQTSFDSIASVLYNVNQTSLYSHSGNYIGQVSTYADTLNGTLRLQCYFSQIDSIDYNFRFTTTGSGRLDVWSSASNILGHYDMVYENLPSVSTFPDIAHYKVPDESQQIVSNWACSDKVITVGNFTNRSSYVDVDGNTVVYSNLTAGAIAASSSSGPSRLGEVKPDVAAPGDITLAQGAAFQIEAQLGNVNQRNRVAGTEQHHRAGGTSSASPVVAGIAALFLEKCPNASWQDFKTALHQGTYHDVFTGGTTNNTWGYGKADALQTLSSTTPHPGLIANATEFCAGDSVALALDESFDEITWINGLTDSSITVKESGYFFAEVKNDMGCVGYSDSLSIYKRPIPSKPIVMVEGNLPACANEEVQLFVEEEFGAYEWSNGKFTNRISVTEEGWFVCEVRNIYGCANTSDSIQVTFLPGIEDPQLILEADGHVRMYHDTSVIGTYHWYQNGSFVSTTTNAAFEANAPGIYHGVLIDSMNCEFPSNELVISLLSAETLNDDGLAFWPNPTTGELQLMSDLSGTLHLLDTRGRLIRSVQVRANKHMLNIADLPSGTYFMQWISTEGSSMHKLHKL